MNSRAQALAGVDAATPDPPDGRIERTAAGEPQGTLHEGAMNLVQRVVPTVILDDQVAGILEGQRYLHSLGITAWQEAIVGEYAVVPDCFEAYREVDGRGVLTARVVGALWWRRSVGLSQLVFLTERRAMAGQGRFRTTSVKVMQDGVCENFTAALLSPYLDGHGHETGGRGTSFFDPAELGEAVTAIDARGYRRPGVWCAYPRDRGPGGPQGAGRDRRRPGGQRARQQAAPHRAPPGHPPRGRAQVP